MKKNRRGYYVWIPGLLVALVHIIKLVITLYVLWKQGDTDALLLKYLTGTEAQVDTGITIISIAIAVWIGLNIYTYIEKTELEKLSQNTQKINERLNSLATSLKMDFLEKLNELRKLNLSDGTITIMHEIFLAEFNKNKYTYEIEIYDMLHVLKVYDHAYRMHHYEGKISENIGKELKKSIDKLSQYKLGAVYHYFVHFLYAELSYLNKDYHEAKKLFEDSQKLLEASDPQTKIDTNRLTPEQTQIIMGAAIGWTTYRCGSNYLNDALSYYKALPKNVESQGVVYDLTFLSRYYRNRGVLLENKGKESFDDAKASYKEALLYQSELHFDLKASYSYSSIVMKIWDEKTQKTSLGGWMQDEEQIKLVKEEYGDAEAQLLLAKNAKPSDASIYIQYAKLLTYKALIMKSEKASSNGIKETTDEAFLNINMAVQLLPDSHLPQVRRRVKYIERDLYCALYVISSNSSDKKERDMAKAYLKVASDIMAEYNMDNDEAKKLKEQIDKLLKE
ncbi:MAG: hypothetical protein ACOX4A_05980 [Saccharofermentanales bacterium]|jgi:hypothetical protein